MSLWVFTLRIRTVNHARPFQITPVTENLFENHIKMNDRHRFNKEMAYPDFYFIKLVKLQKSAC